MPRVSAEQRRKVHELEQLEHDVVQTAVTAHCKPDDEYEQELHHKAVSALIEARYQLIKGA